MARRSSLAAALALLAALTGAPTLPAIGEPPPVAAPLDEPPVGVFGETLDVPIATVVVRVVDTHGNPILGLTPEDLRARLDGDEVPIVGLDWVGPAAEAAGSRGEPPPAVTAEGAVQPANATFGEGGEDPAAGRLVVVFVQADLHPTRISGQMRLRPYTRELLAGLRPGDRVAVASFDSHLKLRLDFNGDPAAIHAAIDRSVVYNPAVPVPPAEPFSLARHFDVEAAKKAASPERALELLGRAMQPLPGEKIVLFLGWGLGRFGANGVTMTPNFAPAVGALRDARAAVFVLDVTSADAHSLAVGLEDVAFATGGQYFSTFRLPGLATRILTRSIAGYYVVTLDGAALAGRRGTVDIGLRRRRLGTVLGRPLVIR
jgi:hypothetical protein